MDTAIGSAGYKVIASSDEVAKALADSMIKSAKQLLAGGKLNTTSLTPIIEKEQRLIAANKKVIVGKNSQIKQESIGGVNSAGEYLDDFKPSSTPLQLIQQQAGQKSRIAYIRMDHILNGDVKTYKNGIKVGSGGHYLRNSNVKVDSWVGSPDFSGVSTGYISVRDTSSGQWIKKQAETSFFPEYWSKRQATQEIESAFKNSTLKIGESDKWIGTSSSGVKIEGYYGKPDGTGTTALPVYQGVKK